MRLLLVFAFLCCAFSQSSRDEQASQAGLFKDTNVSEKIERTDIEAFFWMHIQKTGRFLDTIISVFCGEEFDDENISLVESLFPRLDTLGWKTKQEVYKKEVYKRRELGCRIPFTNHEKHGNRYAMHWPHKERHKKQTITLFRDPVERVLSAFFFKGMLCGMRPRGMPQLPRPNGHRNATIKSDGKLAIFFDRSWCQKGSEAHIVSRLDHYLDLPGITGCQTKMVLGYLCGKNIDVTPAMVIEAKRRVREDFLFVGISKPYFTESIELFHNSFLPKQPLRAYELGHIRDQNTSHAKMNTALAHLTSMRWDDHIDRELYDEAVEIFSSSYARHSGKDLENKETYGSITARNRRHEAG